MNNFDLKILDHYWIEGNKNDPYDLCSHGKFLLKINNEIITNENLDDDWTISTTALMLLRSLNKDHIKNTNGFPIAQCCGQIEMIGCPISIDMDIKHEDNLVIIDNVEKIPTTNEESIIRYKSVTASIPFEDFRIKVIAFAKEVIDFFENSSEKNIDDQHEEKIYKEFWKEFYTLYNKYKLNI